MTDINPTPSWANVRQLETNEFATGGFNGNMNEQAKSLAARSELLKQYAALPYESKTGGYALNERVQLATGDIVRSTIPSNVNNPNVDMTGWVNLSEHNSLKNRDTAGAHSAIAIFDASGKTQQEINNSKTVKSIVELKNSPLAFSIYVESVIGGENLGAGWFYWDDTSNETENTATIVQSNNSITGRWKRVNISNPNPTWWGCIGKTGDADNFKKAIDWAFSQKKRLTIDSKISLEKQIQIWGTYGWDFCGGGEFVIVADVTPLKFMSLPRNATFYNTKVSATVDTSLDNAFAEFSARYQIEGLRFFGFEFIHTTRKWNGIVFSNNEGVGTGGISGGSLFIGFTGAYLRSLIRFKQSTHNYFVNATTFQNIRDSYCECQIETSVRLGECNFINCTSQENTVSTIAATGNGAINRSNFDLVHNWDNNVPAIVLSKNSRQNSMSQVYVGKVSDSGFYNTISKTTQTLRDSAVAAYSAELNLFARKDDLARLFNIQTGLIKNSIFGATDGTKAPVVLLNSTSGNVVSKLFAQNDDSDGSGLGVIPRYARSIFGLTFKLVTTTMGNYSFLVGICGSNVADGGGTTFNGGIYLTNIDGNFAIVKHTGFSATPPNANLELIKTLNPLDSKTHSFSVNQSPYQSAVECFVSFDDDHVEQNTFTTSLNRSPLVSTRYTTANTSVAVISADLVVRYNQGWI